MKRKYTVLIYTENATGLLTQFSNVFTRRNLDIWSINAGPSQFDGIHRIIIQTEGTDATIQSTVLHLEKKVEVVKAFGYPDSSMTTDEMVERSRNEVRHYLAIREEEEHEMSNNQ